MMRSVAYFKRSDSGERRELGKRVRKRGETVFFACCYLRRCPTLRRAFPHYLNAWKKLCDL